MTRTNSGSSRYITRGKTSRTYSTTPLWNHLKHKHPTIHKNIQAETEKDEDDQEGSTSTSATGKSQPTLAETFKRSQQWTLDDPRSKEITKVICKYH